MLLCTHTALMEPLQTLCSCSTLNTCPHAAIATSSPSRMDTLGVVSAYSPIAPWAPTPGPLPRVAPMLDTWGFVPASNPIAPWAPTPGPLPLPLSFLHCAHQANTCTELRACRADAHRQALTLQEERELNQRGAAEREAQQVGGAGEGGRWGEGWRGATLGGK